MSERKQTLLEKLIRLCVVRWNEGASFSKEPEAPPNRSPKAWTLDFRKAFLDAEIGASIAKIFWDAYADDSELQIALVEMWTVPMAWFLLMEWLSRGKKANTLIVRKSRKKDGLCNIVEWTVRPGVKTVLFDDTINSWNSLIRSLLTARNEGVEVAECFCVCQFGNPDFAIRMEESPFRDTPVKSMYSLNDFWLENEKVLNERYPRFYAWAKPAVKLSDPHLGIVVPKSSPLIADGALYASWEGGELVKIDLATREVVWRYSIPKTDGGKNVLSSIVDCGDEVCFWAYDGAVHFVNKTSWSARAALSLSDWIGSTPECDMKNDRAFVWLEHAGTVAGGIAMIRISSPEIVWERQFSHFVHASPAYCDKTKSIYCWTNGGEFVRLSADSWTMQWRRKFDMPIKTRPTVSPDGSSVFVWCFDGMLRCFDAETWTTRWECATPYGIYSEALWGNDGVFVWCTDKHFYHFNWSGELLAKVATGGRIFSKPSRYGEKLVAFWSNDWDIRFYHVGLRKIAFAVEHSERIVTSIAFSEKSAYFEDFTNRVWEFDLGKLIPAK